VAAPQMGEIANSDAGPADESGENIGGHDVGDPTRPTIDDTTETPTLAEITETPDLSDADAGAAELLPDPPTRRGRRRANASRQLIEWVVLVFAALFIAVLIKTFLFQPFYIPSSSMEPTLHINDRIFVNKLSYHLHNVNRGDIVVFETPPGQDDSRVKDYVKRVIALPGETVVGRNGAVFVDGKRLIEPYVSAQCADALGSNPFASRKIPAGYVWVMGDNRCNSSDSRVFGPIKESTIVGRAFFRIWPLSRLSLL
jgi:signal peptidase I